MKKKFGFILLYLCLIGVFPSMAQSYKSLLAKYDVMKYLPESSDGKAESFWDYAVKENKDFQKTMEKINGKGGSAQKARDKIAKGLYKCLAHYSKYAKILPVIDSLKYDLLGNNEYADNQRIYYLHFDEANAFCTPNNNIYLYDGLISALPSEKLDECLIAVLAHEYTHGIFNHALVAQYKQIKKEKQNKIIAGIATGLAVANDSYSKARGVDSMIDDVQEFSKDIFYKTKRASFLYQFKYGREQEYQADIVAFRFLDWVGIGGEALMVSLLSISDPYESLETYEDDDHPSMYDRISLLKYMCTQKRVKYIH